MEYLLGLGGVGMFIAAAVALWLVRAVIGAVMTIVRLVIFFIVLIVGGGAGLMWLL